MGDRDLLRQWHETVRGLGEGSKDIHEAITAIEDRPELTTVGLAWLQTNRLSLEHIERLLVYFRGSSIEVKIGRICLDVCLCREGSVLVLRHATASCILEEAARRLLTYQEHSLEECVLALNALESSSPTSQKFWRCLLRMFRDGDGHRVLRRALARLTARNFKEIICAKLARDPTEEDLACMVVHAPAKVQHYAARLLLRRNPQKRGFIARHCPDIT